MAATSISGSTAETPGGRGTFDLKLVGSTMELTLARGADGCLPSVTEILAALNDAPVDSINSEAVYGVIRDTPPAPVVVADVVFPADTLWMVKLSPSRLAAYVIPAPVAEGANPPTVTANELHLALAVAGVTHGLLPEGVSSFADSRVLDTLVLLAHGEPAECGRPAKVEFLFETSPSLVPKEHEDGSIDYRSLIVQRCVEVGAVLGRRTPMVENKNGREVTGKEIVPAPIRDYPFSKHAGKGTEVEEDTLVATQAGRPVLVDDRVDVLPFYDVKGDLNFSVGNIDFSGDVIIHGDVGRGFQIRATGAVTVQGLVDRATIIAGGDILAHAVTGDEHVHLEAGNDVVAQYLHGVRVTAKGTVKVQREILHCQVQAARVALPGGGRIIGGHILATTEVTAGVIGSVQGAATFVEVERGAAGNRPVIRAAKKVYFGSVITVAHGSFAIDDDLGSSSFWAHEGHVVRLDSSSTGPTPTQAQAA